MTAQPGRASFKRILAYAFAATLIAATAIGWIAWRGALESALDAAEADARDQLRFVVNTLEKDLAQTKAKLTGTTQGAVALGGTWC